MIYDLGSGGAGRVKRELRLIMFIDIMVIVINNILIIFICIVRAA